MASKKLLTLSSILFTLFMVLSIVVTASENKIILHIYGDNSVAVEGRYSQPMEVAGYGNITVNISCSTRATSLSVLGEIKQTGSVSETSNASIELTSEFHQSRDTNIITDRVVFEASISDERGNLKISTEEPIIFTTHLDNLIVNIKGKVNFIAEGEARQTLMMFAMLNKDMIEQYLYTYNITGVEIKDLHSEIKGNTATLTFEINLDINKLSKKPLKPSEIATIRALLSRFTYPINATFNLKYTDALTTFNLTMVIGENINEILEGISGLYTLMSLFNTTETEQASYPLLTLVPSDKGINQMLDTLVAFTETFEVLPSSGYVSLIANGNETLLVFKTPKIVKRGATSPKDTILALYDFMHKAYEITKKAGGVKLDMNRLHSMTIQLAPQENIEVLLNGTKASSVKFGDLPKLQVVVKTPAQTTVSAVKKGETLDITSVVIISAIIIIASVVIATVIMKKK